MGSEAYFNHRSIRLDTSRKENSDNEDHRSSSLDKSPRGQFGRTYHWSRRLDKSHCGDSSQKDHRSVGRKENFRDQFRQVDRSEMVKGATPTPHMVPEFLTGRPMQSQEPLQQQDLIRSESRDPAQQVQETTPPNTTFDPINRHADKLVGINNRPTTQTLTVRPVSSTTLTFDGKSEKFELFEDLFHTMIKMQPEKTESMRINHFHSL